MRDLEMINNVVHSHKTSDILSSKTSSMRHTSNFVEEPGIVGSFGNNTMINGGGNVKTVNHNSNNVSLGSNCNFMMVNDAASSTTTVRPGSVRELHGNHSSRHN
jgi:hypothetical protein